MRYLLLPPSCRRKMIALYPLSRNLSRCNTRNPPCTLHQVCLHNDYHSSMHIQLPPRFRNLGHSSNCCGRLLRSHLKFDKDNFELDIDCVGFIIQHKSINAYITDTFYFRACSFYFVKFTISRTPRMKQVIITHATVSTARCHSIFTTIDYCQFLEKRIGLSSLYVQLYNE